MGYLMVCVCGHNKDKHESTGSRKELLFGFRTLCREGSCTCESYKQKYLIYNFSKSLYNLVTKYYNFLCKFYKIMSETFYRQIFFRFFNYISYV